MATDGLGLAFIAFPAIINEAPAGALIGVLFFGSLVVAGVTSLVSVIEVVISAVRDKFEMSRIGASMAVGVPAALISITLLGTTTGVYVLDIIDHFINRFGILVVAVASMLALSWVFRKTGLLREHLNRDGSVQVGTLVAVADRDLRAGGTDLHPGQRVRQQPPGALRGLPDLDARHPRVGAGGRRARARLPDRPGAVARQHVPRRSRDPGPEGREELLMSTSAIIMMLIAMAVLWGGLAVAIWNINRYQGEEPESVHRDL